MYSLDVGVAFTELDDVRGIKPGWVELQGRGWEPGSTHSDVRF